MAVRRKLPERGNIGIFNRSYYEEVLVVRVHPQILEGQKIPAALKDRGIWKRRFREINDWEHYLTDQGYRFVKLFLNVSKEEQRRRFLARIDEADRNWKFSAGDARERAYWDAYQKAFSDVLSRTSTEWAPWYVVPADDKPFARVAAAGILAHTLIEIDPRFPNDPGRGGRDRSSRSRSSSRRRRLPAQRRIRSRPSTRSGPRGRSPGRERSRDGGRRSAIRRGPSRYGRRLVRLVADRGCGPARGRPGDRPDDSRGRGASPTYG